MTGPQHYTEAERLITEHEAVQDHGVYTITPARLTVALIHATLAQAAATALAVPGQLSLREYGDWQEAAGGATS